MSYKIINKMAFILFFWKQFECHISKSGRVCLPECQYQSIFFCAYLMSTNYMHPNGRHHGTCVKCSPLAVNGSNNYTSLEEHLALESMLNHQLCPGGEKNRANMPVTLYIKSAKHFGEQ